METGREQGGEYLVRRHELRVVRQFMPDLCRALIATNDAALSGSIQALLRVVFGYQPDIRTVRTIGGVLDGLAEAPPQLLLIDDNLFSGSGIDIAALLGQNKLPFEVVVISGKQRPSDILEMKRLGVADIIHPGWLDSLRLSRAYIRACVFAELKQSGHSRSGTVGAVVVPLSPRSSSVVGQQNKVAEQV